MVVKIFRAISISQPFWSLLNSNCFMCSSSAGSRWLCWPQRRCLFKGTVSSATDRLLLVHLVKINDTESWIGGNSRCLTEAVVIFTWWFYAFSLNCHRNMYYQVAMRTKRNWTKWLLIFTGAVNPSAFILYSALWLLVWVASVTLAHGFIQLKRQLDRGVKAVPKTFWSTQLHTNLSVFCLLWHH
jgi:hypothetical protein